MRRITLTKPAKRKESTEKSMLHRIASEDELSLRTVALLEKYSTPCWTDVRADSLTLDSRLGVGVANSMNTTIKIKDNQRLDEITRDNIHIHLLFPRN